MVKTVHLILQGKGGVGKSLTSSMLAQYLKASGKAVVAIDTDPTNATFASIRALDATHIQIMEEGEINPRHFDVLMSEVFEAPDVSHVVIDTGATCFIALCSYLAQNHAMNMLQDDGARVIIHTPICGGAAFDDTLSGLVSILEHFPTVPVVVWQNEYFGPVERDGRGFQDSRIFEEHAERIIAILRHKKVHAQTYGEDVRQMMALKLSFQEAFASSEFNIMARQRLKLVWRSFEEQMADADFLTDDTVLEADA